MQYHIVVTYNSNVENIILILHGNPNAAAIVLENEYCVWLSGMKDLSTNIWCNIENIDLQFCYGGKYWDNISDAEYHSFAELFAMNPFVHYVYATPGEVYYMFIAGVNVAKGDEQFYRYSYVDGNLEQIPMGSCLYLMERMY